MPFRPLGDRVAVMLDPVPDSSPGGIFIPEASREVARTGTVAAVGARVRNRELEFGVRVAIEPYHGERLGVERERLYGDLRLLPESAVLAILT